MKLSLKNNSSAFFIILEGIAYTIVLNLYNPFIQMFAKRMGAQDIHIALLNSIPPLVAIFVLIPFGILIERANRKKKTAMLLIFLNSLFYALIVFVPFLPDRVKVLSYVILIGIMNWPGSLYLATWQSFFADSFSGTDANRVYSLRSKYGVFFGLVTVLITGFVLTEIPKTEGERLVIYQVFYAVCFIITLLQLYFFSRVEDTRNPAGDEKAGSKLLTFGKADIKEMLANKSFLVFCGCAFLFHVAWQMGWPLFFIYNVKYAGLNELQISIISVAASVSQFLTFTVWNRLIEKKGSSLMIIFGAIGLAVNPFFYTKLFGFYYIVGVNIIIGIAGAGFTITLFASLLETLPENKKTIYISVFNTLINISGFASPLIGIWIYKYLSIYSTMFVIGVLRVIAASTFIIRWRMLKKRTSCKGNALEA